MGFLSKLKGKSSGPESELDRKQVEDCVMVLAYQPTLWKEIRASPRYHIDTTLDRSVSGQLTVIGRIGNLVSFLNGEAELSDEEGRWTAIGIHDLVAIHERGQDLSSHLAAITTNVVGPEKPLSSIILKLVDPGHDCMMRIDDVGQARERLNGLS